MNFSRVSERKRRIRNCISKFSASVFIFTHKIIKPRDKEVCFTKELIFTYHLLKVINLRPTVPCSVASWEDEYFQDSFSPNRFNRILTHYTMS